MGLCRTNVMLDRELWKAAKEAGKPDDRSGSWIVNKALKEYLNKGKKKAAKKTTITKVENAVMFMPLNSGERGITNEDIKKWSQLYPAVNVDLELRAMIGWLDANPTKRKTNTGVDRFITSWLKRAQDKGGSSNIGNNAASKTMLNAEEWVNG